MKRWLMNAGEMYIVVRPHPNRLPVEDVVLIPRSSQFGPLAFEPGIQEDLVAHNAPSARPGKGVVFNGGAQQSAGAVLGE